MIEVETVKTIGIRMYVRSRADRCDVHQEKNLNNCKVLASAVSNGAIYQDVKGTRVGGVDLCGGGSSCISFLRWL